ncbi:hypothetical protein HJFPF1_00621 [Paramyrothecium foliicola]|nr:hypothetical protein HJFPF1_00621 [Paramyrothecium foliicola]
MDIKDNVRTVCSRVQTVLRLYRRKEKRHIEISAPFNFRHEAVSFPGISEQEIAILREQAAASCIGIIDSVPRSPSLSSQPEFLALGFKPTGGTLTTSHSVL